MWEKWKLLLSTDTTEQKRGMATRRLHKQLNPSGRRHPHVCPQSDEKSQGTMNKGHLGVTAEANYTTACNTAAKITTTLCCIHICILR